MTTSRFFAIVPAAGRSQRMGRSKLMLRWRGQSILQHVLSAWQASQVTRTLVVLRRDDLSLRAICTEYDVDCVCPETDPRDMKQSVQCALEFIARRYQPTASDAWLVAPADMPKLSPQLINAVITHYHHQRSIVLPRCGSRGGHPVLFPWSYSSAVWELADDEGLDRLIALEAARNKVAYVDQADTAAFEDVDTPEDFERLSAD